MANKRILKKYIKNVCGDIAGECIFAKLYFGGVDCDKMDDIIVKAAFLQTNFIDKVSVCFDKAPKSFEGTAKVFNSEEEVMEAKRLRKEQEKQRREKEKTVKGDKYVEETFESADEAEKARKRLERARALDKEKYGE